MPVNVTTGVPVVQQTTPPAIDSTVALVESDIPRVMAGTKGWDYQQSASADLDGDGDTERAVLLADVQHVRDDYLWGDTQRWVLYVEEADSTRTWLYAQSLHGGRAEPMLASIDKGKRRSIVLSERMPRALSMYEIEYLGPGKVKARRLLARELDARNGFVEAPR